jgi:hypothetical protein
MHRTAPVYLIADALRSIFEFGHRRSGSEDEIFHFGDRVFLASIPRRARV